MSTMTLEQVRDRLREEVSALMQEERIVVTIHRTYLAAWADAIDAHLAQPAQAVGVGAIRDVIEQMRKASAQRAMPPHYEAGCYMAWIDDLTRAISGEKAGLAGEWEAAFHAQRAAAMRSHTVCYETMLAHPEVAELGDDGRLHDAIHDILRVDGPASPAPDKEG